MSTTVKAHGMDGTLVDPDWPPLTLTELRLLLSQFPDLGEPLEIMYASPRPFSAASIVRTAGGWVFIKRHSRAVRNREGLLEEHRFMAYLLEHGAAVPRVLASGAGETAIGIGAWTYEVHETPEGVDLYEDALSWTPFRSVQHAHSAGQALARLHRAAEGFAAPRRKPWPLVAGFTIFEAKNPSLGMRQYLAARPALAHHAAVHTCAERALELLAPFHTEIEPLLPALTPLWTHNDLHASNLLWSDASESAQATAVIDFGLADRTNAVHDIAQAVERNIVEWLTLVESSGHLDDTPVHFDHLDALLVGYESVRQLTDAEAAALAPMTALCHAEFALTEADYFLGVLHSEEKGRVAYDDYLVGHAQWFRGKGGGKLLAALRCWAGTRAAQGVAQR
jgi:Ser/Thr protein kinase RdoA (MazF antagonist)